MEFPGTTLVQISVKPGPGVHSTVLLKGSVVLVLWVVELLLALVFPEQALDYWALYMTDNREVWGVLQLCLEE